jgi:hypothetical protein
MDERSQVCRSAVALGLDPGFGAMKAARVALHGDQVAIVPSGVGVGSTDLGMLSVGSLGRRRQSPRRTQVGSNGITYLVGENAAGYARAVERMGFLRL